MVNISINLPDSFFEEETRFDFHISKKRKEIWAVELDLLKKFDEVCSQLNIRYFLDSGTLLGAVRDGHFIPWDDDIDVIMLRSDYDVLLDKGTPYFEHPYFLQNGYTDYGYFRGHSQIRNSETSAILPNEIGKVPFNQGIFLDVFVLDYVNEEILPRLNNIREKYYYIESFIQNPVSPNPLKRMIKPALVKWYKKKYGDLQGLYARVESLYKTQSQTEYVDKLMFRRKDAKLMKLQKKWFDEEIRIDFEGFAFPIPKDYDEILKVYYGQNYMIPDRNAGTTHSGFGEVIFDTDRSYKEVLRERGFD